MEREWHLGTHGVVSYSNLQRMTHARMLLKLLAEFGKDPHELYTAVLSSPLLLSLQSPSLLNSIASSLINPSTREIAQSLEICSLPTVWSWARHLASLSLIIFIMKTETFISLGMINNYLGKKCFLNARMIPELLSKSFEVFLSAQLLILGSAHS